jgi:hypothetical protein
MNLLAFKHGTIVKLREELNWIHSERNLARNFLALGDGEAFDREIESIEKHIKEIKELRR